MLPGEADSAQAQMDRAWFQFFDIATEGDANDVLVCHGNVIRWFTCRALGVDTKQWSNMDIANCSVTIITIKPDGTARLVTFSDVAHIPPAKQTWAGKGPGMGLRK
jgi:serine/threonine-protein phosphatase PGAM5